MLLTFLKFIYSFKHVSTVLVLTVRCKHLTGHPSKKGLMNRPICKGRSEKDESATYILCDCEATATTCVTIWWSPATIKSPCKSDTTFQSKCTIVVVLQYSAMHNTSQSKSLFRPTPYVFIHSNLNLSWLWSHKPEGSGFGSRWGHLIFKIDLILQAAL
jgi:hypothetical protein